MTAPGTRPLHLQPVAVALVLLGGLLGAPARYAVSLAAPTRPGQWPTATFVVNVVGAFLLGLLLATLERRGSDTGSRRRLRFLIGTGFLGAFTTYSTLALDADLLVRDHHTGLAIGYALASLAIGLCATVAGLAVAGRLIGTMVDPDVS